MIKEIYYNVKKEVSHNPRVCDMCGCVETMDNLILEYDNGLFMCDDCAITAFMEE